MDEKMPSESYPLLPITRVHASCRRRIFKGLLGVAFVLGTVYWFGGHRHRNGRDHSDIDIDTLLLNIPSTAVLRNNLKYHTSTPHLTGTENDYILANWTRDQFLEYGIEAEIKEYWPYLNYPISRRLAVVLSPNSDLLYEAELKEDVIDEDSTSQMQDAVPTFHGYSANGNVTAPLIYANYGSPADFDFLAEAGINVTGAIVIVRYGNFLRSLKVRAAEMRGAVGVIIYSDPYDDGYSKGPIYPDGPWRPESSVQRGSVSYNDYGGDPLTPGWPSTKDAPRLDPEEVHTIPKIPSLPISYRDALPFLRTLVGFGRNVHDDPTWRGALDIEYWTGPSEAQINLVNEVEYKITPVWNVMGKIEGWEDPDKVVIIGSHRDAWVFGAVDSSSGSVTLLEVARSFGILLKYGWRPRRSIIFASWDGEEYAFLGSTEFVEDHLGSLRRNLIAYINVDGAVSGPHFYASASPSLTHLLREVTSLVSDPFNPELTIYDNWLENVNTISGLNLSEPDVGMPGSGSDYLAFLDHLGVASMDILFGGDYGVYHSNYDSFHFMDKLGDPGFFYHATMTKIMSLVTARLADSPLIPLNATHYAHTLPYYISLLQDVISIYPGAEVLDLVPLHEASKTMLKKAEKFEKESEEVRKQLDKKEKDKKGGKKKRGHDGEGKKLRKKRDDINQRGRLLERSFVDTEGLPDRPWYKHVIFGPGSWAGYAAQPFPGIAEWTAAGNWEKAQETIEKVAAIIRWAGKSLDG